jgi:hypothetical protein
MLLMRRIVCGLGLAAIGVLAMAADPAAAEKQFPLEEGGQVVLKWRPNWSVSSDATKSPPGSISFQDTDVTKMRGLLIPVTGLPAGSSDHAKLHDVTVRMAGELAKQPNAELLDDLVSFEGASAHGYYVTGLDHQPKPNEYKFIYSGFVGVGEMPFMFNILWNDNGKASAKAMLESLKDMRIDAPKQ